MRWRCKQERSYQDEDGFVMTPEKYFKANKRVFEMFERLEKDGVCKVLHIEKGMFPDGTFRMCRGKKLYMRDANHITPPAAIELFREVWKEFAELLK